MKFYIAGPISSNLAGYKTEFAAAETLLRAEGHDTINPAENPPQPDWESYMACGIQQLCGCDGIALLPNWRKSKGAKRERWIARMLGMPIREL